MSRVSKRKHVVREMYEDNFDHPTENQQIVRVISSRGNNLHEVETATESDQPETFLVSMPVKFRNNIWIKRGMFIIIESIEEGNKVRGEIVRILTPEHVKEFTKDGIWPKKFTKNVDKEEASGSDSDSDLIPNTNRKQQEEDSESTEEEDDSDDDEVEIGHEKGK